LENCNNATKAQNRNATQQAKQKNNSEKKEMQSIAKACATKRTVERERERRRMKMQTLG